METLLFCYLYLKSKADWTTNVSAKMFLHASLLPVKFHIIGLVTYSHVPNCKKGYHFQFFSKFHHLFYFIMTPA